MQEYMYKNSRYTSTYFKTFNTYISLEIVKQCFTKWILGSGGFLCFQEIGFSVFIESGHTEVIVTPLGEFGDGEFAALGVVLDWFPSSCLSVFLFHSVTTGTVKTKTALHYKSPFNGTCKWSRYCGLKITIIYRRMLPPINTFSPIHSIQLVVKYVWFARKKKIFMLRLFCNLLLSFVHSCNLLLSPFSIGCPLVQSAIECWFYWLPTSALTLQGCLHCL